MAAAKKDRVEYRLVIQPRNPLFTARRYGKPSLAKALADLAEWRRPHLSERNESWLEMRTVTPWIAVNEPGEADDE